MHCCSRSTALVSNPGPGSTSSNAQFRAVSQFRGSLLRRNADFHEGRTQHNTTQISSNYKKIQAKPFLSDIS